MKLKRAKDALCNILDMFESGNIPEAISRTMITPPPGYGRPCDKWSLGNKIFMILSGTTDARGYKQWQKVGRQVKKGAKAFYILAPNTRKTKRTVVDKETCEEKEEIHTIITGFRFTPVFRYEDTEGEPLPEFDFDPPELPPLQDVARKFGVDEVIYSPGDGTSYGFYSWSQGKKRIVLHTHDIKTWFHELGHVVHATFKELKAGQNPEQEIVAEIFAAVMCELYGVQGYHAHAWDYVKHYADDDPQKALQAVFRVLSDVEECLNRVFKIKKEKAIA
ncbi:MAG TPA: M48 family peptidase [Syntrophomonadaceae bacterium]|jgi:antirestriction protein ArdC|nr:M48 family peptidase [Syntrophomonadaceae bacterium]